MDSRRGRSRGGLHGPDRTHFDGAVTGAGATRGPGKCGVEIGHVDQVVAAELLFGVDVRAVEDLRLAIGNTYGGCGGGFVQGTLTHPYSRLFLRVAFNHIR